MADEVPTAIRNQRRPSLRRRYRLKFKIDAPDRLELPSVPRRSIPWMPDADVALTTIEPTAILMPPTQREIDCKMYKAIQDEHGPAQRVRCPQHLLNDDSLCHSVMVVAAIRGQRCNPLRDRW